MRPPQPTERYVEDLRADLRALIEAAEPHPFECITAECAACADEDRETFEPHRTPHALRAR